MRKSSANSIFAGTGPDGLAQVSVADYSITRITGNERPVVLGKQRLGSAQLKTDEWPSQRLKAELFLRIAEALRTAEALRIVDIGIAVDEIQGA